MSTFMLLVALMLGGFLVVFLGRLPTLVAVMVMLTYKSSLISLASCEIENSLLFRVLQASDFFFAGIVTLTILATSPPVRKTLFRLARPVSRAMLIVSLLMVYGTLLGLLLNPADHVAIYLRLLAYPILLYVIGVWLSLAMDLRQAAATILVVLLPASLLVVVEFLFRPAYHDILNSACYHSLKFGQASHWYRLEDVLLFSNMRLFNLEIFGDIQFIKPYGVTLNYPSTSYLMLLGLLASLMLRRFGLMLMFLLALLLMTTKASLFMLLSLMLVPWVATRLSGRLRRVTLWTWLLGFGVSATAWLMLTGRNIHAYSLLASLVSLPNHPLGNGIGWGGSLTVQDVARTWDEEMLIGDSGLAILTNMLGIAGIVIFFIYARLFINEVPDDSVTRASRERLLVTAFGIGVIGNAILQELAVGPYALGMALMLLAMAQAGRRA